MKHEYVIKHPLLGIVATTPRGSTAWQAWHRFFCGWDRTRASWRGLMKYYRDHCGYRAVKIRVEEVEG